MYDAQDLYIDGATNPKHVVVDGVFFFIFS